ncbi:unnamed protein product, partial [Vitis vinifera]|uniref:Uncharacterized protein n=1 Tax=Vitis vinifera TaxID=29760 RepID=D7SRW5_VITVI
MRYSAVALRIGSFTLLGVSQHTVEFRGPRSSQDPQLCSKSPPGSHGECLDA